MSFFVRKRPAPHYAAPETAKVVPLRKPSAIVVYAAIFGALFYFPWRVTTLNPDAWMLSALLFIAEGFGAFAIALHAFMTWRMLERKAPPPPENATVDIFIPTYNEPVEMLRRTLLAARACKYPHETWLLDDGNRPAMAALAEELGVRYLARKDNAHAKAGNLNHALHQAKGDFVCIFDADHVPHENFIIHTLGYFNDPRVAFVQTPQDFYNLDSFQHRRSDEHNRVWTEQSLFFRVIMPGKDYWNAAFFCGSCAIARREAILDIGGFAIETVTEDLHTSLRLHKRGWASAYHAESLAFGIAPDTFEPYESQRVRWGQGAMQVWRLEGMLSAKGLTWAQRFCYLASSITYFDGWQKVFMYLLPAFVIATGILPIVSLDWIFALHFVPWWIISLWACEELGRGYAKSWVIEQYNFLRWPGFAFATLTFFVNRKLKFKVTKKEGSSTAENLRQMKPHLAVIAASLLCAAFGAIRMIFEPHMQWSAFVFNLIWIGVITAITTSAVRFALNRSKQERSSYRFRMAFPILLRWKGQPGRVFATDDISSGGFRVHLPANPPLPRRAEIEAELILPSGRRPVPVSIQRVWLSGMKNGMRQRNLAVKFHWPSQSQADALDRYLYSTNAESLLGGVLEKGLTPVDYILQWLEMLPDEGKEKGLRWVPTVVLPEDASRAFVGLAALNNASAAQAFLCERGIISDALMLILPNAQHPVSEYRVGSIQPYRANGRDFHLHRIVPLASPHAHRKIVVDWRDLDDSREVAAMA